MGLGIDLDETGGTDEEEAIGVEERLKFGGGAKGDPVDALCRLSISNVPNGGAQN
jgi:hypothetical protein